MTGEEEANPARRFRATAVRPLRVGLARSAATRSRDLPDPLTLQRVRQARGRGRYLRSPGIRLSGSSAPAPRNLTQGHFASEARSELQASGLRTSRGI